MKYYKTMHSKRNYSEALQLCIEIIFKKVRQLF
jgi:hypothetical protein